MEFQEEKPTLGGRLRNTLREYGRVLRITKKPTKEEYWVVFKVTGIGILIIGFLGFVITLLSPAGKFITDLLQSLF